MAENVREFLKKFKEFRQTTDPLDKSAQFNKRTDQAFIKLKKTLRDLDEKIDDFEVSQRRAARREAKGLTGQSSNKENKGDPVTERQVKRGEAQPPKPSAGIDLLDLDFSGVPAKPSQVETIDLFTHKPLTFDSPQTQTPPQANPIDLLDLDFGPPPTNPPIPPKAGDTAAPAPAPAPAKKDDDFFDRLAIRQDFF